MGVVQQNFWSGQQESRVNFTREKEFVSGRSCIVELREALLWEAERMKVIWDPPFWKIDPISTCIIENTATRFR